MAFLGGRRIPAAVSMGFFLCFTVIEHDDLRPLQWLHHVKDVTLDEIRFDGWNVVHCCSYFGRSEIFLWLKSLENVDQFVIESCARSPCGGNFSSHVAVKRGHALLAELLLASGCPLRDNSRNKSVYFYTKRSDLDFVREWGEANEKSLLLGNEIETLACLLSSDKPEIDRVKKHVTKSKCLDPEKWVACEYKAFKPGPLRATHLKMLDKCCTIDNPSFVVWLCQKLLDLSSFDASGHISELDIFWGHLSKSRKRLSSKMLSLQALQVLANQRNNELLHRHLCASWAVDLDCVLPTEKAHILRALMR